ncbi:hypothetical protein BT69DRAFT_86607 [Atractiella rhizophila]|nr:hypothetical protein BT69DRAFT_86607 [Atractiella rhizophila]
MICKRRSGISRLHASRVSYNFYFPATSHSAQHQHKYSPHTSIVDIPAAMLSSLLTGGPDCGPSNPLSQLTKSFPSTSTSSFQPPPNASSRAFSPSTSRATFSGVNSQNGQAPAWASDFMAFRTGTGDVGGMGQGMEGSVAGAGWGADFLNKSRSATPLAQMNMNVNVNALQERSATPVSSTSSAAHAVAPMRYAAPFQAQMQPVGMMGMGMGMGGVDWEMEREREMMFVQQQQHEVLQHQQQQQFELQRLEEQHRGETAEQSWTSAFAAISQPSITTSAPIQDNRPSTPTDLSATARLLLETVSRSESHLASTSTSESSLFSTVADGREEGLRAEREEKFRKSEFFEMMRGLRDGELEVRGENVVPVSSSSSSALENQTGVNVKAGWKTVSFAPAPLSEQRMGGGMDEGGEREGTGGGHGSCGSDGSDGAFDDRGYGRNERLLRRRLPRPTRS